MSVLSRIKRLLRGANPASGDASTSRGTEWGPIAPATHAGVNPCPVGTIPLQEQREEILREFPFAETVRTMRKMPGWAKAEWLTEASLRKIASEHLDYCAGVFGNRHSAYIHSAGITARLEGTLLMLSFEPFHSCSRTDAEPPAHVRAVELIRNEGSEGLLRIIEMPAETLGPDYHSLVR